MWFLTITPAPLLVGIAIIMFYFYQGLVLQGTLGAEAHGALARTISSHGLQFLGPDGKHHGLQRPLCIHKICETLSICQTYSNSLLGFSPSLYTTDALLTYLCCLKCYCLSCVARCCLNAGVVTHTATMGDRSFQRTIDGSILCWQSLKPQPPLPSNRHRSRSHQRNMIKTRQNLSKEAA